VSVVTPLRAALAIVLAGTLVGCASADPASPTSSPSFRSVVAADSEGGLPIAVAIGLGSGLIDARPLTRTELRDRSNRRPMEGAAFDLFRPSASEAEIAVVWAGTSCDENASIEVAGGVKVTIDLGTPPSCAGAMTYRGVVLTFDGPVATDGLIVDLR
jgi:type IV pilus biogenesis protein CpaD/CtpE